MANVIEMLDAKGGTKAPDTTLWREHLHAATMVGRVASAAKAVELGYGIEADPGPSGKLGHWKIAGIPDKALAVHSKRAAEITEAVAEKGFDSYQSRQVAARETRKTKRHTPVEELLPRWRAELTDAGFPPEQLVADIKRAGLDYRREHSPTKVLWDKELAELTNDVLGPDGTLSARKVFSKRDVIVAVAPKVFGLPAGELEKATERVLRDPDAIPLVGVPRAIERAFATAHVLATEQAIERAVERGVENLGGSQGDTRGGSGCDGPPERCPGVSTDPRPAGGSARDRHLGSGSGAGRRGGRIGQDDGHGRRPGRLRVGRVHRHRHLDLRPGGQDARPGSRT